MNNQEISGPIFKRMAALSKHTLLSEKQSVTCLTRLAAVTITHGVSVIMIDTQERYRLWVANSPWHKIILLMWFGTIKILAKWERSLSGIVLQKLAK